MDNVQNQNSELNATIKAIDNGMLVLETIEDKQLIRWPLHKLPASLNIDDPLALKLEPAAISPTGSVINPHAPEAATENERHKLLENLIN